MDSVDEHESNCNLSMAFLKFLLMGSVEHDHNCQLPMAFLKFLLMSSVDEHECNCQLSMAFLKFGGVEHEYNCHLSMAFLKFLLMGSVDKHDCNCHLWMAFLKFLLMGSVEHECNPHRPKLSLVKGILEIFVNVVLNLNLSQDSQQAEVVTCQWHSWNFC